MTHMSIRAAGACAAAVGSLLLATAATAEVYELPPPGTDVIGAITTVEARAADTLLDIGRRHGVGYEEMVRANPDVDVWLPGEGTRIVLPTRYILPPGPRRGLVLNLPRAPRDAYQVRVGWRVSVVHLLGDGPVRAVDAMMMTGATF